MNHLKNESSPYLLQHAENPVSWYPWCDEAFERAKNEDKPIFLSIGYSTCHWCHVMAHESFENEDIAEMLNRDFISIKVDREERPDIDSVYMTVCQAMTESGGWPMSIFMTWDKKPFYAGTYFPPKPRYGMVSFPRLLNEIARLWKTDKAKLLRSAEYITERLREFGSKTDTPAEDDLIEKTVRIFKDTFDRENGGFGNAPKFPTPHNLLFLMLYSRHKDDAEALDMALKTLLQMRRGGIFDQIGGGFSRYSTDKYFLAPHFEKMLYDNALLIIAYSAAYHITGEQLFLDTAEKTAGYVLREMTSPEGAFYSAQDADSEGVEGKYYTFTLGEILQVLGEQNGRRFAAAFDITEQGNFEGVNIPNLLKSNDLESDFADEIGKLYEYRKSRTKLHLDDKILLSWNSMMIAAFAMLYKVVRNEKYLDAAKRAQEFIEENLCSGVQLYTSIRGGKRTDKAFLDDYAYYTAALLGLYDSTLDKRYLGLAERFCGEAIRRFSDEKNGGFFLCETDSTELFMNPKETYDGAIPSGNSVMAYDLVRLYQLTESEVYRELAEKQLSFMSAHSQGYPAGNSMFLLAKMLYESPPPHITVVVADETEALHDLPFLASVYVTGENESHRLLNGRTTYYVCRDNVCLPPVNEL